MKKRKRIEKKEFVRTVRRLRLHNTRTMPRWQLEWCMKNFLDWLEIGETYRCWRRWRLIKRMEASK